MNWKYAIGVGLLLVAVGFGSGWFVQEFRWEKKIATTPVQRDTTTVVRLDTVYIPKIYVKRVETVRIDSTPTAPRWYVSVMDTSVERVQIHAEYNSPLPLSPRGFFSDISIQLPPRIDSIETVYIAEKVTFVVEETNWEAVVVVGSVGMVFGAFLSSLAR